MAGIGFELQKVLDSEKNYFPKVSVALKSMFITSGPWIISIVTLLLVKFFVKDIIEKTLFLDFMNILIYCFIFSMILSAPFINIITRYLSDKIYEKNFDSIFAIFISGIIVIGSISFSISATYVYFYTGFVENTIHIASLFTAFSILWLIMVFISTLKDYNLVTYSFLFGMILSFLLLFYVLNTSLEELLKGFTIGTLSSICVLIAKLKLDFKTDKIFDFKFLINPKYIPLFISGFFLYLAMWIDKFVYWFSLKGVELSKGFYFFPDYDFVVFISYLLLIPTTAYFTIYIETVFYEHQRDYFSAIENKKNLSVIQSYENELKNSFYKGLIRVSVFQFILSLLFVVSIQYILDNTNTNIASIPLLRITVFAVSLQMILNTLIIFLYYFDYQKEVLSISLIFFISNLLISLFMKNLPYEYVGYSYFYSVLFTLFVAMIISLYKIDRINFYVFSKNEV